MQKNRTPVDSLLPHRTHLQCAKQTSTAPDASSKVRGKTFSGTRRVSRGALHRKGPLPFWRLLYSVQAMLSFFWQFEKFGTGEASHYDYRIAHVD